MHLWSPLHQVNAVLVFAFKLTLLFITLITQYFDLYIKCACDTVFNSTVFVLYVQRVGSIMCEEH